MITANHTKKQLLIRLLHEVLMLRDIFFSCNGVRQPGQNPPETCVYKGSGREWGRELERPCAMNPTMFNLLGFITTVFLTANTHCMMDGLALACLTP